jgi:cytidine deaminase
MSEKDHKKLIELAKQASLNSYSPYSKFAVGCCIETTDGQVFSGCNVENISFGLTICAERAAVFSAISAAGPATRIKKAIIYTPTDLPTTPCGACRQVLKEFGADLLVVSVSKKGEELSFMIDELLPETPAIKLPGQTS